MTLTPAQQQFILHWGEMSSRWGINRSMAQIHALLYLSKDPLNAEQLADHLSLARSNVSTSLRELQAWGVVRVTHRLGDRRDYFQAVTDVWDMFLTILEERKRREVDPILETLRQCLEEQESDTPEGVYAAERMQDMLDLLEQVLTLYGHMRRLSPTSQRRVLQLGARLEKIVGDDQPSRRARRR